MTNILERVQALAPAALTEKTARLLSSTPEDAGAWLTQGQTAGLKSEAALVHHAHLQQRLTQMRVEALQELSEPQTARDPQLQQRLTQRLADIETTKADVAQKMADRRLSEEQKLEDGYGRVNAVAEDHQKAPIAQVDRAIRALCSFRAVNGIRRTCGGQPNCVGTASWPPMSRALSDEINAKLGTNIDLVKVSEWEGGQSLTGYVPWHKGGDGLSGITIASAVDFGNKDVGYMRFFDRNLYPAPPGLIGKLAPYIGRQQQAACTYLSDHPLVISLAEAEWLDRWAARGTFYPSEYSKDVIGNTIFGRYDTARKEINTERQKLFQKNMAEYQQALIKWETDGKAGPKPVKPNEPILCEEFRRIPIQDQTVFYSVLYRGGTRAIPRERLERFIQQDWKAFWRKYEGDSRAVKEVNYQRSFQ
jgi:hypothetical protein